MNAQDLHGLHRVAVRQAGLVHWRQARDHGFSYKAIGHRVASGAWNRRGSVLQVLHGPVSADLRLAWTAQLAVGGNGIVSGPVAARLGSLPVPGAQLIAISPHGIRDPPLAVTVLRREVRPADIDTRTAPGLRLLAPLPALIDTLVALPWDQSVQLIDRAMQLRWLDRESFIDAASDRLGRGRKGATRVRALVRHTSSGSVSDAERELRPLLRRSSTGPWEPNAAIHDARGRLIAVGDFVLRALRIVIEVDGRAAHSGPEQFERDRARQNALVLEGWLVLRFTYAQIITQPGWVIRQIRAAVAARQVRDNTAL